MKIFSSDLLEMEWLYCDLLTILRNDWDMEKFQKSFHESSSWGTILIITLLFLFIHCRSRSGWFVMSWKFKMFSQNLNEFWKIWWVPINYSDQSKQKHHGNCAVVCLCAIWRSSIKYSVCCMWYVIVSRSGFGAWIALLMPCKQIISSS